MPISVTPFLMFTGQAEEAMRFYVSTIKDSKIVALERSGVSWQVNLPFAQ